MQREIFEKIEFCVFLSISTFVVIILISEIHAGPHILICTPRNICARQRNKCDINAIRAGELDSIRRAGLSFGSLAPTQLRVKVESLLGGRNMKSEPGKTTLSIAQVADERSRHLLTEGRVS